MARTDDDPFDISPDRHWYRFGVLIAILHLVFLGVLLVLLQWDLVLGLVFAVVVSVVAGLAITVYALRRR